MFFFCSKNTICSCCSFGRTWCMHYIRPQKAEQRDTIQSEWIQPEKDDIHYSSDKLKSQQTQTQQQRQWEHFDINEKQVPLNARRECTTNANVNTRHLAHSKAQNKTNNFRSFVSVFKYIVIYTSLDVGNKPKWPLNPSAQRTLHNSHPRSIAININWIVRMLCVSNVHAPNCQTLIERNRQHNRKHIILDSNNKIDKEYWCGWNIETLCCPDNIQYLLFIISHSDQPSINAFVRRWILSSSRPLPAART